MVWEKTIYFNFSFNKSVQKDDVKTKKKKFLAIGNFLNKKKSLVRAPQDYFFYCLTYIKSKFLDKKVDLTSTIYSDFPCYKKINLVESKWNDI